MALKFANSTCGVGDPTRPHSTITISKGEAWDADDPFVKARPDLFDDEPPVVRRSGALRPVETATAGPGESRNTGRKRAAKKSND